MKLRFAAESWHVRQRQRITDQEMAAQERDSETLEAFATRQSKRRTPLLFVICGVLAAAASAQDEGQLAFCHALSRLFRRGSPRLLLG